MKASPKIYVLLLLLLSLINTKGPAQTLFDNPAVVINAKSGLPSDHVTSILKDDQGFIWLSTSKGLCRWDGMTVKTFEHNPADSSSISGNSIARNAFIWDSLSNRIILGTEHGLSFFDPSTLTSENYYGNGKNAAEFLTDIHTLFIDRQKELWLGTDKGLTHFSEDGRFNTYSYSPGIQGKQPSNTKRINDIFDIRQDLSNDSILWLATLEGLLKFNKYSKKFRWFYFDHKKYKSELNAFTRIIAHPNRKLYLATWNADMIIFNTVNDTFEAGCGSFTPNSKCNFAPIIPCAVKSENELWISSPKGVGVFNTATNSIHISTSFKNPVGHGFSPSFIFTDDHQAMWLASEYGAYMYRLSGQYFKNYFFTPVDNEHWFITTSFYEDTIQKRLYIGYARGEGLHYFDLTDNTFHYLPLPKKLTNVNSLLPYTGNQLLIACSDQIYKFSLTDMKPTPILAKNHDNIKITGMKAGRNGQIWVTDAYAGLLLLNPATGKIYDMAEVTTFFNRTNTIPNFGGLLVDTHNQVWLRNSESYGYYIPDKKQLHFFEGAEKLNVLSFYQDRHSDTVWVGTRQNGLGFINPGQPEKGIQIYLSTIKRRIYSLQRDDKGNFFLLTPAGIEKLVPDKQQTVIFNQNDGLIKFDDWSNRDPTQRGLLYRLSNGSIVIGYRRGLGFFHPDSLSKKTEHFAPYISAVTVFDKEMLPNRNLFNPAELGLSHKQNFLSISYSALAPGNGNDILLSHKLTGVDRDWVSSESRNIIYSGLQPGNYHFLVKAESRSIPGLVREASLSITIRPPWWKTWWATLLFVLFALSLVYSIYRYQLGRILARKETVRLKELDKLKSRLYANITHEFRTPLTVIKGISGEIEEGLDKKEKEWFNSRLKMINRNSDKLLHLVQQMLDMSKIEEGKMKLHLIRNNIVSYLQYVLESFQSMADAKNIKLVFYRESDEVVMDYDQDKIFVIASNLLSNAIKFTPNGGKVIFHVKKEKVTEKGHLVIKVQDSGIGIEEKHLPHIFDRFYQADNTLTRKGEGTGIGLALTKELVELMGGTITVESMPNVKTEFCVSLPITQKAPRQKSKPVKMPQINEPEQKAETYPATDIENNEQPLALVVEDNTDVAQYIISCLAGKYRVKWSPDGEKGIETAIRTIPDIIISDVMMPGKDGFEVCDILKQDERTSHIPIVLLTAKATDTDRIEGLSHGADAYLTKPFNKKELFVRLEQLIRIRRQLQEKFSKVEIGLMEKTALTGEERFLKKALKVIEKKLDSPELDAALLASELYLSESQLYRKLKALSGKSTSVFIRSIRLSAAKKLLETGDLNISEVAYQCGFNDPAWFSRTFKKEFGISPSEVKK
jgi:signal transduction histidine kinase/DNA-binding response OmpR family regulator/ligand-binding sensor domain-containing protein